MVTVPRPGDRGLTESSVASRWHWDRRNLLGLHPLVGSPARKNAGKTLRIAYDYRQLWPAGVQASSHQAPYTLS